MFTEVSRDELRDWVRAQRIAGADAGEMAAVIEPPHVVGVSQSGWIDVDVRSTPA